MAEPPKRRLQLRLDLEADSLDDLEDALRSIANDLAIEGQEERETTSGGYRSGYHLSLKCDPEQTGDDYRNQLLAYVDAKRAAVRAVGDE